MAFQQSTRRELFRLGGSIIALSTLPHMAAAGQPERKLAHGIVFEDRSGTGLRQPGDPGIPGVLVSNGREVAKTNEQGAYVLPIESDCVIFVIKPGGWTTPLDPQTNLPRFYRLHQPEGSPESLALSWPGVEPTGPLPESIDFPLVRKPEPARFDVLMLADPQPANAAELDFLRESFFGSLAATPAAFGLTLGDVMSDNLGLYDRYNRMLAQIGLPWWNLPGNHDLNYEAADRRFARETWKTVYGPSFYAFEYGEATFIMLDNVDWSRSASGASGYAGRIGELQLEFVRNLLAHTPRDRLIVVCMHIPLVSADADSHASNTNDRKQLLEILGERPAISFSGHMHTGEHHYLERAQGSRASAPHHHQILTAVSGSWWSGPLGIDGQPLAHCCDGAPNGFSVLSIDGLRASTKFISRETQGLRVSLEGGEHSKRSSTCLTPQEACGAAVMVNVFDGGPLTDVTMTLGDGQSVQMTRIEKPDPFTQNLYAKNPREIKSWVQATDSTHLWSAHLPDKLDSGFHRLTVHVRDEFGREVKQTLVFEILPA